MIQNDNGSTVTATIFKENSSAVYDEDEDGYDPPIMMMDSMKHTDGTGNANKNAYFALVFDHDGLGNITSLGLKTLGTDEALVNQMIYGDCTVGSLMGLGRFCMPGEPGGSSMMAGTPSSLEISAVATVLLPSCSVVL